jgi:glyoxylase-like metal-dependent hydrolase (beta-lactamase superfamily II)
MKIQTFVLGSMGTNCYLIENEQTKECILVDPATDSQQIYSYLDTENRKLVAILLTHGHFDHVMGVKDILASYETCVYAHEKERFVLQDPNLNLSAQFATSYGLTDVKEVQDNEVLHLAGWEIEVLHTPGHTSGSCCYYFKEEGVLFSGDTLFAGSVGRADFPTGNAQRLQSSLKERVMALPDEIRVYPGHMQDTTIGEERVGNPYVS